MESNQLLTNSLALINEILIYLCDEVVTSVIQGKN